MRGLRSVSLCVLLLALLGASCTIDSSTLDVADTYFQGPNERVDLVFVVDDSNSMEPIQTALATQAPAFLTALEATGSDYRAGVVTTDMNDPNLRYALEAMGGEGGMPEAMSIAEYKKYLRNRPEWLATDNGRKTVDDNMISLAKMFGIVG